MKTRTEYNREYYAKKKDEIVEQKRAYRKATRLEVVRLLGGTCSRCGYEGEALYVVGQARGKKGYATFYNDLYRRIQKGERFELTCANCSVGLT